MAHLRQFLYLDRHLVRDLLAQAEGGVVDEQTNRSTSTGKGGFGAELGAGPAKVRGEKGRDTTLESESILKQVAASEFDRLYACLNDDDLVLIEEANDEAALGQLKRKQFIEVDARLRLAGLQQMLDMVGSFAGLLPLVDTFEGSNKIDDKARKSLTAMASLASADGPLPIIATVPGQASLKVALELQRDGVLSNNWDTEATVLLKIQRVLKEGDRYLVGDPFGGLLSGLPEAERKNLMDSLSTDQAGQAGVGESEITAPGLVATPIGIYR